MLRFSALFRGVTFAPTDLGTQVVFPFASGGSSGWAMDDIAWGDTAPVPLPGTLPMMLAGLGGLGIALGRRRRGATG